MEFSDTHLKIEHPQRKGCGKSSMTVLVVDDKYTDDENVAVIDQAIAQLEHMRGCLDPVRWELGERWPVTPAHRAGSRRIIYIKEFRGCVGMGLRDAKDTIDYFLTLGEKDPVVAAVKWANRNQHTVVRVIADSTITQTQRSAILMRELEKVVS